MAGKGPLTTGTRKALTDSLGTCHTAEMYAQFLEVTGHPGAEEAIDRFRHLKSTVAAALEFDRKAREGEL